MSDIVRRLAKACRPILVERARSSSTIRYGQLAHRVGPEVGLTELDGQDPRLHDALDVLSMESYDEGKNLLLSVVVVRKDTRIPGDGFYSLARKQLGAYPLKASREEIFAAELGKVYQHYSRSFKAPSRQRSGPYSPPK